MTLRNLLPKFVRNQSGATSIEYGMIAALMTLGLIGAITAWGESATGMYESLAENGWSDEDAGEN